MDEGVVVGVGAFFGGVVGDFGEDEGGEVGGPRGGGGGVFGEDGVAVGDAGVEEAISTSLGWSCLFGQF